MSDMRDEARRYLSNGVTPIPVRADGTKRPAVSSWRQWHDEPFNDAEIDQIFANAKAIGVICGKTSGNLELLEFEGRAIEEVYVPFLERIREQGLMGLWREVSMGYTVKSPSGGMHIMFRVEGEPLGNTKLARRPSTPEELAENPSERTKVLIETRGQGGFVVAPPSNGAAHQTGLAWEQIVGGPESIVMISVEQRDALYEVAASFDATVPDELPVGGVGGDRSETVTSRSVARPSDDDQSPLDWARENINPQRLLEEGGWTPGDIRGNEQAWTRPGKSSREGTSATLHLPSGPLNIYSTSMDLEYERAGRRTKAEITLSVGELYAAIHHLGDVPSASRYIRQHLMPQRDSSILDRLPVAAVTGSSEPATATDAEVRSADLNLPDEFWEARPLFGHVRQAAWSQPTSPDNVLLALLARYAATIHPSIVLPGFGTLDFFVMSVSRSGGSKSTAAKTARRLFPIDMPKVRADAPVGSGQGLVEGFFRWVDEDGRPCSPQKKGAEKVQWYDALNFIADEGTVLVAGGEQSIISQVLSQAWTGDTLGQLNADGTRNREIQPGRARVTAIINIQMANGWKLFSGNYADQGFSQRMICTSATDPRIFDRFGGDSAERLPDWPGPVELPRHFITTGHERVIGLHPDIAAEIEKRRVEGHNLAIATDPLDTHYTLARLKVAAILALMDDRFDVNLEDWDLASQIMVRSRNIRLALQNVKRRNEAERNEMKVTAQIDTEVRTTDAKHKALVRRGISAAMARIEAGKDIMKRSFSAPQRAVYEEIMAVLEAQGLVEEAVDNPQGGWRVVEH